VNAGSVKTESNPFETGEFVLVDVKSKEKHFPIKETEECLQGVELKDLSSYFAPELEGVAARCERKRQPSDDPRKVGYGVAAPRLPDHWFAFHRSDTARLLRCNLPDIP
jgi:hypothetical protein